MKIMDNLGRNDSVTINGVDVTESKPIMKALASAAPLPAHHSHGKDENAAVVAIRHSGGVLKLLVCQDSKIDNEFWIFTIVDGKVSSEEIGRVQTDAFNEFFKNGLVNRHGGS